jgi:dephospho-CoA kinase
LVGRAGSGKSSVARQLESLGACILDADRMGHEVTDSDEQVRAALQKEYGAEVYLESGKLDRAKVAARVFADPAALARLNQLVHPRILEQLNHRVRELASRHEPRVVVVDAALMLDWGYEESCDAVLAVTSPQAQQVARLVSSRGWTAEQALARLANQQPSEYFERLADEVIHNDGSEQQLRAAVQGSLERMVARRGMGTV